MSTRRLIAFKHEGGYEYVHLCYDGDTAADKLDTNWSTEYAARDLVAGGDILSLAEIETRLTGAPGHNTGTATDLEDLFASMLGNEHLVSIFDPDGAVRKEVEAIIADDIIVAIDNPDTNGPWLHLADSEEIYQRYLAQEETIGNKRAA